MDLKICHQFSNMIFFNSNSDDGFTFFYSTEDKINSHMYKNHLPKFFGRSFFN